MRKKKMLRGKEVADNISCYPSEVDLEISYWLTIIVGLVTLALLGGCKGSPERMLVGTWKIQGPETAAVWTYRADHTLEFNGYDEAGPVSANGTWRVEGSKLTFSLKPSARHDGVPDTTNTIIKLTATQLQLRTVGETVVTLNRTK